MQISGWGRYPIIDASVTTPLSTAQMQHSLQQGFHGIARGLGRSYGDSSLAEQVMDETAMHHITGFDEASGVVSCQAGVSFADLLEVFVPKGWFPPVTPGTKYVTVGGAIASDVHGKNHHVDGSFCDHVTRLTLLLANGELIDCSPEQNRELFCATCGGMGLTGIIVQASIRLKPISSAYIQETTRMAGNLSRIIELFEEYRHATYSVAWIDCAARGRRLGRSLLMLGEHCEDGDLAPVDKRKLSLPVDMPDFVLNHYSIKAFNSLVYHRKYFQRKHRRVHYDPYFYPLDSVLSWNRLYGKKGFTQYQFVLPLESSAEGMHKIMQRIAQTGRGSPLAVLKTFGKGNENYLSFPMEGLQLALDFKINTGVFEFLNELDSIVLDYGGRLYLTKDVRMSETMFKRGYPQWHQFMQVRRQYGADGPFHSLQSQRLGI